VNHYIRYAVLFALGCSATSSNALARDSDKDDSDQVKFTDIVPDPQTGVDYRRQLSPTREVEMDRLKTKPFITAADLFFAPTKPRGAPGVAILDFDNDGDEDIYVTNGPGGRNSLYVNQLEETGKVSFIDKANQAGVAATAQDSSGVCYGDIDNDGFIDLLVLNTGRAPTLFHNNGNGTFTDISVASGIGTHGPRYSATCSMGDVNGDGLLDIAIANTTTQWDDLTAGYQANQLFVNQGGNHFVDASQSSGFLNTYGPQYPGRTGINGDPGLTWTVAMVDYDMDGAIDIITASDQTGDPSVEKGFIQIFHNDGKGQFTNVTETALGLKTGGWMGLSFGDINCDGYLDFFVTNMGDYLGPPQNRGQLASRWFLGSASGRFLDPGVNPELGASEFGWGTGMADLDNDGDSDIVYYGGEDFVFNLATNPGIVLKNQDCSAKFQLDRSIRSATNQQRRNVNGLALGDLDNNGFTDVVSVSSFDIPPIVPLTTPPAGKLGSPLDDSRVVSQFSPLMPLAPNPMDQRFVYNGYQYTDGTLSIELNSGNDNNWVKLKVLGTKGLTDRGRTNRNGIGAVLSFTPEHAKTSIQPILGGSSYGSQHSLSTIFGLGKARRGRVDVLWTGGTRNRLYDVREGEVLTLPEIPCSYTGEWHDVGDYRQCVRGALRELVNKNLLTADLQRRLYTSALRAFASSHGGNDSHGGDEGRDDDENQDL
jgi:hypothetical protein